MLQGISWWMFLLTLAMGAKIIAMCSPNEMNLMWGNILLLFWPSGFFHGTRIGNDSLLYLFQAASLWQLCVWMQGRQRRNLTYSAMWACWAMLSKANGFVSIATVALVIAAVAYKERSLGAWTAAWPAHLWLIAGVVVYVALVQIKGSIYTNIGDLRPSLLTKDDASSLFGFGWKSYFQYFFIDVRNDGSGRRHVFNFLLKSSLFGEFKSKVHWVQQLARIDSTLLLGIVAVMGAGAALCKWDGVRLALLIFSAVSLGCLVLYRLGTHSPCASDFRYIYTLVIPMAVFYMDGVEACEKRWGAKGRGGALALLAVFVSTAAVVVLNF